MIPELVRLFVWTCVRCGWSNIGHLGQCTGCAILQIAQKTADSERS